MSIRTIRLILSLWEVCTAIFHILYELTVTNNVDFMKVDPRDVY